MAGSDRLGTAYADCLVFLSRCNRDVPAHVPIAGARADERVLAPAIGTCADRKSTRLNSSHGYKSYAGFCLKKNQGVTTTSTQSEITFEVHLPLVVWFRLDEEEPGFLFRASFIDQKILPVRHTSGGTAARYQ